jgi:hypothetical protein
MRNSCRLAVGKMKGMGPIDLGRVGKKIINWVLNK